MTGFTPCGKHLIGGEWVAGDSTFASSPAHGPAHDYSVGSPDLVARACAAAADAFDAYAATSRADRARFLEAIADEIEARADAITEIGTQETGLPEARLNGERGRTTGQLRLFADHIRQGDYLDRRTDKALPDRQPAPRPEIRMQQRPIGPVAVFGASNFPLAFSTAGGDTAAALAAGCPVVVKGHSAHPGTGEIIAGAIHAAIRTCGVHPGVFSLVQGGSREVGEALVTHPLIKAVGFTGSLAGGRALFDLCAARPEPIPFFGELGSVNPMFLLPQALAARADTLGQGWAGSLTMGAGQFCTNPGIAVVIDGADADRFTAATVTAHHLLYNRNALFTGGIRPHYYCLPVLKRETHRAALVQAATSGSDRFFLGTDSAPHPAHLKEHASGCAGCYTAHAAMELYAEAFDAAGALDKLEGFASFHGADFYGLARNTGTVTLQRESWTPPASFAFGDAELKPLRSGEALAWRLVG